MMAMSDLGEALITLGFAARINWAEVDTRMRAISDAC